MKNLIIILSALFLTSPAFAAKKSGPKAKARMECKQELSGASKADIKKCVRAKLKKAK